MNAARNPMVNARERIYIVSHETAELLRRPIVGRGGFQSLLRRFHRGLEETIPEGVVLIAALDDVDALIQRSSAGGLVRAGGFQQRILALITDILFTTMTVPTPDWARAAGGRQLTLPIYGEPARRQPLRVIRGGKS